ncbi:MAG TPA: Gmad2 immunoglobulin-like domain-containing protein [Acidimicrobiales bacterium]|nr:Gmad2 immunoglobulin-like domain-containing protein [Acidimicrobiales bacterium]
MSAGLSLSLGLAGCGSTGAPAGGGSTTTTPPTSSAPTGVTTTTGPAAPPSTQRPAGTTTSTTPAPKTMTVRLYLMRGDKLGASTHRVAASPAVATAALTELLVGPDAVDRAAGLSTTIPAGSRLLGLSISGGTATVDMSAAFASGGGSLSMTARLAQVVYTATQFPAVSRVTFLVEGRQATVFGGEGIVLDHPSTRSDFEAVTPAILVEAPTPATVAHDPVRVLGTANVFEAAFRARLIDSHGRTVVDLPVRATSGTGTRGTFDVSLHYPAAAVGPATLEVFDLSAKDGSTLELVAIPLVLR